MDIEVEAGIGGSAAQLLEVVKNWRERPGAKNSLVLISLAALPVDDAPVDMWLDFKRLLLSYRSKMGAEIHDLTLADRAMLMELSEYSVVGLMSDLKIELLRIIQQHFPETFGRVDQSRLVRVVPLKTKRLNAIKFLEYFAAPKEGGKKRQKLRRLHDDDIRRVEEVHKQLGPMAFARAFVRSQRIVRLKEGRAPAVIGREFFVSMDSLKQHVFPDVEMRGSGTRFNQLTVTLDRLLLDAWDEVNPDGLPGSINLNVESVFTRNFERFLRETRQNKLEGLTFEFRQADILQSFDEFVLARDLIQSKGGKVAVDAVFTETVGIVNLLRLGVSAAKIFWRQGAEQMLMVRFDDVNYLREYGTEFTICRVDDEAAIEIGREAGITHFQGFYIDRMLPPED